MQADVDPNAVLNNAAFTQDGQLALEVSFQDGAGGWHSADSYEQEVGSRADPVMANQRLTDASGNAISGATTMARIEPLIPAAWTAGDYPIVGVGTSDTSGRAILTPALTQYIGNPQFETANDVMVLDLYRLGSDGTWAFASRVPYYLGASQDPVLARLQLLDGSGQAVDNRAVVARAVPIDLSSWPQGQIYPPVGSGHTDSQGMVVARSDLSRLRGNAVFESASGAVRLQILYEDSDGSARLGATVDEQLTAAGDLVVLPAVPGGGISAPASSELLQDEPMGATPPAVGSPPGAPLDLSKGGGGSTDVSPAGILEVGVYIANDSGAPTYQATAMEYVGAQPYTAGGGGGAIVVDVTQKAWGAAEDVGCLASNSYGYGDPNYDVPTANGTCEWTNPPTDTKPYVDPAVTGQGGYGTSAVTINLDWRSVMPTSAGLDSGAMTKINNEVGAVIGKYSRVVLTPRFQAEGVAGNNCQLSSPTAATNQYLPNYVVTDLGGSPTAGTPLPPPQGQTLPSGDNVVCDTSTGLYMPNYFSSAFQADWTHYLSLLANYFGCVGTSNACTNIATYTKADVDYVRVATGLSDESNPWQENLTYSTVVSQYETPTSQGGWGYSGQAWDSWQRSMLTTYQSDFGSYATVMYPISLLLSGSSLVADDFLQQGDTQLTQTYAWDVATWAWSTYDMGLGQNGLNPGWALDQNNNNDPANPKAPYAQTMWLIYNQIIQHIWSPPPYVELQTVGAATQDCFQSSSDKASPYYNGYACTFFSHAGAAGTVTSASWNSGTATVYAANTGFKQGQSVTVGDVSSGGPGSYDGTFTLPHDASGTSFTYGLSSNPGTSTSGGWAAAGSPYDSGCAAMRVTLNVWLANQYVYPTVLEGYYNDLDYSNTDVEAAYKDWETGDPLANLSTDENEYYASTSDHDGYCPVNGG